MSAGCGPFGSAACNDPFAYIGMGYAPETIVAICSIRMTRRSTAITRTGS
jgi:hypothetical protein